MTPKAILSELTRSPRKLTDADVDVFVKAGESEKLIDAVILSGDMEAAQRLRLIKSKP